MIAPEDQAPFIDAVVENAFGTTAPAAAAAAAAAASGSANKSSEPGVAAAGQKEASVVARCVHYDGTEALSLVRFRCVRACVTASCLSVFGGVGSCVGFEGSLIMRAALS